MIDNKTFVAFHGDAKLKADLLKEVARHRELDHLRRGTYSNGESGATFRGCAVGCSLESLGRIQGKNYDVSRHATYERAAGVPRLLARVQDRIFEGLPWSDAMQWPERFWDAIPVGADLRPVCAKWLAWIFGDEEIGIWRCWKTKEDQDAIKFFAAVKAREGDGETVTEELNQARDGLRKIAAAYLDDAADADAADADAAADAAAYADAYAAYAAADAAAYADAYADAYAYAYAYAAANDAANSARENCYRHQADKLVELLKAG
jgi:hypothetical protein